MEIYAGLISPRIKEAVREGAISQHIVCGVDIYLNTEDNSNPSKRHFKLIDILEEDHCVFLDIPEARTYLLENKIGVFGLLKRKTPKIDKKDVSYALSPLTKQELRELMDWRNDPY